MGFFAQAPKSVISELRQVWTGAVAIGAIQKLPHVRFVQPYRNWSDPRNPPLVITI